jgi:hypothetical protein
MTQASEGRREGAGRSRSGTPTFRALLIGGWIAAIGAAVGVRLWNALAGPLMWGYDAWGHVAYVLFLDIYRAVPWADQGWSYFHRIRAGRTSTPRSTTPWVGRWRASEAARS